MMMNFDYRRQQDQDQIEEDSNQIHSPETRKSKPQHVLIQNTQMKDEIAH